MQRTEEKNQPKISFPDFSGFVKDGRVPEEIIEEFREFVFRYYRTYGRHDMRWRHTTDPYLITVSEVMLQQTQVPRVEVIFPRFVEQFPTAEALAFAPEAEVIAAWQGMGYNRRALSLQKLCRIITEKYGGIFPKTPEELIELPGIGPATSCSISAFAFNAPVVFIETNIRRIFIHCFFRNREEVDDKELFPLVKAALPKNAREWYWALMDLGSVMKHSAGNPNRKSRQYVKQSAFEGSKRQVRGRVLKEMLNGKKVDAKTLAEILSCPADVVSDVLEVMTKEGFFIRDEGGYYRIKSAPAPAGNEPEKR
ncbi:MAG TPA: A/G-specific adenine glycosylase [Methanocorpusculum sp.]|nr:A/G-specific adenine glycosylase [Methanocorpusculum sp.]